MDKYETYSFTYTDENGVCHGMNCTVPSIGMTIYTFHDLCRKFALSCGYLEASVNSVFGEGREESYEEYMRD